jgi:FkbM family methyltransferase
MESCSQFGEDKLILKYFCSLGITEGVFLEIGANHPTKLSQTWLLEKSGWHGILIEPLPHLAALLRSERPGSRVFEAAVSSADRTGHAYLLIEDDDAESVLVFDEPRDGRPYATVAVRTLDDILAEAGYPRIDFLSIDIEGAELPALQSFDFHKYRPRMILIEDHCKNLAKHRFLKSKGYKIVNRCGCNNWYVPKEMAYSGPRTTSRVEILRKVYLGLPFRMARQWFKSRRRMAAGC